MLDLLSDAFGGIAVAVVVGLADADQVQRGLVGHLLVAGGAVIDLDRNRVQLVAGGAVGIGRAVLESARVGLARDTGRRPAPGCRRASRRRRGNAR